MHIHTHQPHRHGKMSGRGKVVCVTGASGFIASWLVKYLLVRQYTVRATVRSLRDPNKVDHLMALEGAKERLHLVEANLIEEGSYDSVVDGCDAVFHTASPVIFTDLNDPQAELLEPAVKGTLNVLRSCVKVPSIERVVLTSSIASVLLSGKPMTHDVVVDETSYSDPAICEEFKLWYFLSKTLAEEAAWKFAEENGMNLVVLNPGYVIGPLLQPNINATSLGFLKLIKEGMIDEMPDETYVFVDVRDVADAHILALENVSARGRYLIVERVMSSIEALKILHDLYPLLNLPKSIKKDQPVPATFQISKARAKSLGVNFISPEKSFMDTVESLMEKNFLSPTTMQT